MNYQHYRNLAELFIYPNTGFSDVVCRVRDQLSISYPTAYRLLEPFERVAKTMSLHDLQELFTRSFDVQAITTLDVGYVLFGDDYKRGELLANLSREHRLAGTELDFELGDHLPNMLKLIAKLTDDELRNEIAQELIAPAVKKMLEEFDPERILKKDSLYKKHHKTLIESFDADETRIIYRQTLRALQEVLARDFGLKDKPLIEQTAEFFRSVATEMNVECNANCSQTT